MPKFMVEIDGERSDMEANGYVGDYGDDVSPVEQLLGDIAIDLIGKLDKVGSFVQIRIRREE